MTRIIQFKKAAGGTLSAVAVSGMLIATSATVANAWHRGVAHGSGILPGVIGGAIVGGAIKGKKGVIPGAIIGGAVTGLATQAARRPAPPPPSGYYPAPAAYNNTLVYNIQASLTRLGYNPGPIDGVYGQRTSEAISAFEYNSNIPVTGRPTPELQAQLQAAGG